MILAISIEQLEEKLGVIFGKIGKFFMGIFNTLVDALDKFFPHEVSIMLLVVVAAIGAIYIFTQKINK